jgi:hypothetical protein
MKRGKWRAGMVVRKLFRIAFAFALFVKAHRIASHSFCIAFAFALFVKAHRIALFSHCIRIALLAFFSHFRTFSTFLVNISRLMHQKFVKRARKMRKICKKKSAKMRKMRKSAKCECDAKMGSKFASHRTTVTKIFHIFAFFRIAFASHYHPWWRVHHGIPVTGSLGNGRDPHINLS